MGIRKALGRWWSVAAALATLVIVSALVTARQAEVGGRGHALDANLRLGSGGFNSVGSQGMNGRLDTSLGARRYHPGGGRSLYTVNRAGGMSYSQHNAFAPNTRYRATGYRGNFSSHGYHRQFRYRSF